ncbi:MAG: hypothetical protein QOJ29_2093 [Thermoleophilaceae bacterium]|nr:hypothetical protein [Thermoleophilaceae bacterium]
MIARGARSPVLTALLALAFAAPAHAAGWTTPVALQPTATAAPGSTLVTQGAHLVVNASGAQALSWDDMNGGGDDGTCIKGEATTRVSGGDWAPTTDTGCGGQLEIGPDGTAIVVWEDSTSKDLEVATAPPGGSFGQGTVIDTTTLEHTGTVAAVDSQGHASVAWTEYNPGSGDGDLFAISQNSDGSWPATADTVAISASTLTDASHSPRLAIGPTGERLIVMTAGTGTGQAVLSWSKLPLASSWTSQTLEQGPVYFEAPRLLFDSAGRATVTAPIQESATPPNFTYRLIAFTRPADSTTWGPEETIPTSANSEAFTDDELALDSKGNAQVAFIYRVSGAYDVRAATRAAGTTTWSSDLVQLGPAPCATTGLPRISSVSFDTTDNATISFLCDGTNSYMYTRAAGSTAYSPFTAPVAGSAPIVTTDPNGYLIATWTVGGVTYTSVYDAVAPSIDSVTPPSNPVAGQATTFQVTGSDFWGPLTYSIDFGDGSSHATGRAFSGRPAGVLAKTLAQSVSHTYANAGDYTATISVTDSAANTVATTRPVSVAAAPATPPVTTTQTPDPPVVPPITGLPDPIAGLTVNIAPITPPVRVKLPGAKAFVPLTSPTQIRVGAIIDTTRGRVRMTIDNGHGGFDSADFYQGVFKILQTKSKNAFASLQLFGGSFKGCLRAPRVKITTARKNQSPTRSVRHLWGEGTGSFRTVGRFSSATVRGTNWLTDDKCNGTLTRVKAGKVAVRDFVRKKTIVLRKGKKYFATAKPRSARKR